jgi:pimeloyl-ACP methyl ester carboxylesterase
VVVCGFWSLDFAVLRIPFNLAETTTNVIQRKGTSATSLLMTVKSVVDSRGCLLHYKRVGAGEPIVFIQGVGVHGDGWLPQTQTLSSEFECVTFDNRGMGKSQPAGGAITVQQMAEDTVSVMDAAGIRAAHLVGHSLGGVVALQTTLFAPERVKSLSLLCTSARGADATQLSMRMVWLGLRSRIGSRSMRRRAFIEIVMPAEYLASQDCNALAERLEPLFGHDLADTPPIVMRQLGALKRFDARASLAELKGIPTLVVSAAEDMIFPPRSGRALADGIPGARYVELDGVAHGMTIQAADRVNQLLRQHFKSAGATSK